MDSQCSSGRGFLGLETYVKKHKPNMILLENVASLFSKRQVEGGETAFLEM